MLTPTEARIAASAKFLTHHGRIAWGNGDDGL